MILHRDINTPYTPPADWYALWEGDDNGLICAWQSGITMARTDPELATKAKNGELPVTPFKGGIDKPIKAKGKIGALHYIAFWQGLRGEDLHIDQDAEPVMTCTRTNVTIHYTSNIARLLLAEEETGSPT